MSLSGSGKKQKIYHCDVIGIGQANFIELFCWKQSKEVADTELDSITVRDKHNHVTYLGWMYAKNSSLLLFVKT